MAKERADKPRKEKAEKKVSQDKVKKHKKDKKPKLEDDAEISIVNVTTGEDSAAQVVSSAESPTTASKPQQQDKKEKKQKKAEKELKKKSKKGAIEAAIEEGASTSKSVELPVRPTSKGSDGSTDSDADSDADSTANGGAPLFTIDVEPSAVVPQVREEQPKRKDTDERTRGPPQMEPPSGLNRQERRRIRMIEEQREKIQKKLGVAPGSTDKADEVQQQLDKWVTDFDGKSAIRAEKRKARKAKEAARIRNKRGKALTGRRLVERKKELHKLERANKRKQGLSAPVEA
ncbi:hypothetical protein GGR53DRAFT_488276 [Hypoxylon sp. FL1150]|nr:hypothetical protein GGR53DRAFT_488276 [Hypoxylon sp. FL1150]